MLNLLGEKKNSVVKYLRDLGLSKEFLDMKPEAQHVKPLSRRFDSCAHETILQYLC